MKRNKFICCYVLVLLCVTLVLGMFACDDPTRFSYWYGDYEPSSDIVVQYYGSTHVWRWGDELIKDDDAFSFRFSIKINNGEFVVSNGKDDPFHALVNGDEELYQIICKQWLEEDLECIKKGAHLNSRYLQIGDKQMKYKDKTLHDYIYFILSETEAECFGLLRYMDYDIQRDYMLYRHTKTITYNGVQWFFSEEAFFDKL